MNILLILKLKSYKIKHTSNKIKLMYIPDEKSIYLLFLNAKNHNHYIFPKTVIIEKIIYTKC